MPPKKTSNHGTALEKSPSEGAGVASSSIQSLKRKNEEGIVADTSTQIEKFVKNQGFKATPLSEQLCLTLPQETFLPSFSIISDTVLKKTKKSENAQKFIKIFF